MNKYPKQHGINILRHSIQIGFGIVIVATSQVRAQKPVLKEVCKNRFYVGTALNEKLVPGKNTAAISLLKEHFNSITPENCMKWERIHPKPGVYNFAAADSVVALGQRNQMFTVGHCLIWHSQVPSWVFEDSLGHPLNRDALLKRMHDHIFTIMHRYKGRIQGYDVVNEALEEDGSLRKSKWFEIVGEDYIEKAFEYAGEADPDAQLYYNDYDIEQPAKRNGVIRLISNLQNKGIKVSGIGIQGHYHLNFPSLKDIDETLAAFSRLGIKIMFTELDINVLPQPDNQAGAEISQKFDFQKKLNPYPVSLPDSMQQKLASRYAGIFSIIKRYKSIYRVTFWGINDGQSWLNNWPIHGRTNYPLLFDRNYQPKAAFYSVIKTLTDASASSGEQQ